MTELVPTAEAVIYATEETDLAKLGVSTSGLGLPDDLKNAPLSIIPPSEIQVQVTLRCSIALRHLKKFCSSELVWSSKKYVQLYFAF